MTNPQRTIELLDRLESRGFDDPAFSRLHHFGEKGRKETISSHRRYCETTTSFVAGDTNEQVQRRLELVLDAYERGGFRSGRSEVLVALAEAAVAEIPVS